MNQEPVVPGPDKVDSSVPGAIFYIPTQLKERIHEPSPRQ
jgi:hypothetical protein